VLETVPFAIWVLGDQGELRFTNRPEGLPGQFADGPPPWELGAPAGLRSFTDPRPERFLEQENRPTESGQIITLRDITEAHLRAQQASREDRLQAMGLMAAELAHEIRNPWAACPVRRHAGGRPPGPAGPGGTGPAHPVGVQRLNALVTNTLTFSRDISPAPRPSSCPFWRGSARPATCPSRWTGSTGCRPKPPGTPIRTCSARWR